MAIGKNKKLSRKGKGQKKKTIDPLSRKEWFDLRAPVPFKSGSFGKTLVNKSAGQRIATEIIKGRVVESSLADLQGNSDQLAWRKVRLIIDEVEGRNCKTSFYGLDITRDKLCQMIRKWQTLLECNVEAKTQDGYILRVFIIGFTRRLQAQKAKTSYAKKSQVRDIRKKINEIIQKEVGKRNINEFLYYFNTDLVVKEINKKCKFIFPLQNITVRKVKMIKRPKIDATKLNEMYDQTKRTGDKKDKVRREDLNEDAEAQNLLKPQP